MTSPYNRRRRRHIGFKALAARITGQYRAKGYAPAKARQIGQATAGKVANSKKRSR